MKNKNNILLITSIFLLIGCTNASLEKKIKNEIEECNSDKCKIVINQLTDFKWDKMLASNRYLSPEQIEAAIGVDYPYWKNNTRPMIFLYKNKIVYYENNDDNVEHILNNQVIFNQPDSIKYQIFTPSTAIFSAKRVEMSYGEHYFKLDKL